MNEESLQPSRGERRRTLTESDPLRAKHPRKRLDAVPPPLDRRRAPVALPAHEPREPLDDGAEPRAVRERRVVRRPAEEERRGLLARARARVEVGEEAACGGP